MTSEFLIVKFVSQDTDSERTLKLPIVSKQGTKKIIAKNDIYDYEGGYNKKMEANGPECYLSVNYPRGDGSFKPYLAGAFKNGYLVKGLQYNRSGAVEFSGNFRDGKTSWKGERICRPRRRVYRRCF